MDDSAGDVDTQLAEQLEALMSIYPELTVDTGTLTGKLSIPMPLENPLTFSLNTATGKVLDTVTTLVLEPLVLDFDIPITKGNVTLTSSWIEDDNLTTIIDKINLLIKENHDDMVLYSLCDYMVLQCRYEFDSLIFGNYSITTQDFARFKHIALTCERLRLETFDKSTFDCCICLDIFPGSQGVLLHCDHSLCMHCFKEYAQRALKEDLTKLQCPQCPQVMIKDHAIMPIAEVKAILFKEGLTREDLLHVLTEEEYIEYNKQRMDSTFQKFNQMFPIASSQCPRCLFWLFHDDADDLLMRCNNCSLAYCFACNHSWHGTTNDCGAPVHVIPLPIVIMLIDENQPKYLMDQYGKRYGHKTLRLAIKDELDMREMRRMVEESDDIMLCPKCEMAVTKLDGCNKMKCQICQQNFCYLCGLDLYKENPYVHFNDYRSPCYGRLFEGIITDE